APTRSPGCSTEDAGMLGEVEWPPCLLSASARGSGATTTAAARCRKLIRRQTSVLITGKVKKTPLGLHRLLPARAPASLGDPEYHDCIDSIILYNVRLCICVIATNRVERHTKINDLK
ncbi:hypothetical protein M959_12488, partial [Chaetura pelagica]